MKYSTHSLQQRAYHVHNGAVWIVSLVTCKPTCVQCWLVSLFLTYFNSWISGSCYFRGQKANGENRENKSDREKKLVYSNGFN